MPIMSICKTALITLSMMALVTSNSLADACQDKVDEAVKHWDGSKAVQMEETLLVDGTKEIWKKRSIFEPESRLMLEIKPITPESDPVFARLDYLNQSVDPNGATHSFAGCNSWNAAEKKWTFDEVGTCDAKINVFGRSIDSDEDFVWQHVVYATGCDGSSAQIELDFFAPKKSEFQPGETYLTARKRVIDAMHASDMKGSFHTGRIEFDDSGRIVKLTYESGTEDLPQPGVQNVLTFSYDPSVKVAFPVEPPAK